MHYTAREAGAFLGSPAMGGVPSRVGNTLRDAASDGCWLDEFLKKLEPSNLQGGTVDFICVHWCEAQIFSCSGKVSAVKKLLKSLRTFHIDFLRSI